LRHIQKNKDLVSVVLITYNRPERLGRAIKTVIKQTYKNIELLVVDGANSEENRAVVEDFYWQTAIKIKYVKVEPEAVDMFSQYGMQHSRNVGCKLAKGKYIAMLDDDDSWTPDKIEKQVDIFKYGVCGIGCSDIALVTCYNKIISGDSEVIDKPKINPSFEDLLKSFNLSSTSTFLMRRDVLEEIGFWNEKLRGMHEYDLALKMARLGYQIYTVPEPLMTRERLSNTNASYYYIKIAEVIDLWHYFGKDFLPRIGIKGLILNAIKTTFLFGIFLLGYIIRERVWDIIYPLKIIYEQGGKNVPKTD